MQTLHEASTHTLPVTQPQPPISPIASPRPPKPRFRYAISAPVTTMVLGLVAISGVEIAAWTTPTNTIPASVVSTSGPTFTPPAAKPKVVQVVPVTTPTQAPTSPSAVPTHLHAATVPQVDPTTDPPSTDPTVDPTDSVLQPPAPAPVRTHSGPPAPPSSPPAAPVTPEPTPTTAEPTPTPPASSEPSTP